MRTLMQRGAAAAVMSAIVLFQGAVFGADTDSLKMKVKDEARISTDISLERNIDAAAAYKMVTTQNAALVDVRTTQEYQYVGHAPMAHNLPAFFWGKWDDQKKIFAAEPNPDFVRQFSDRFPDKNAPIIIMCRSGHRSVKAIKLLTKAGYTKLYHMWEGFEGIAVSDKSLPTYGMKVVDGWKNKGLPYTWEMESALIVMK